MKRAVVITTAMIYTAKPVTPLHIFGVLLSVFGTILYQKLNDRMSAYAMMNIGTATQAHRFMP